MLAKALPSVFLIVGTAMADADPIFFYSSNYDACSYNGVTITDANNSPTNNYTLCAYLPDQRAVFNCPGDPICWTWGQTCNANSVQCSITVNGKESNWCCGEGQKCTQKTGQTNVCWSGFSNPDKGLSGSVRAAKAESSHAAVNSAASSSLSAYSRTASATSTSSATTLASTTASASPSTTAGTSTSTSTSTNSSTSGLSTGAKIGVGVGVGVGVLGLAALGAALWLWRRSRNKWQGGAGGAGELAAGADGEATSQPAGGAGYYSPPPMYDSRDKPLPPMSSLSELPHDEQRVELQGGQEGLTAELQGSEVGAR